VHGSRFGLHVGYIKTGKEGFVVSCFLGLKMTTVCERITSFLPEWVKTRPQCRLSDKCLLGFYIVLLVLMLAAIVSFVFIGTLWLKVADERQSVRGFMKPQCANDGFKTVTYVSRDSYLNLVPQHVKIYAYHNGDSGAYSMTFYQAEDMCRQLNSTLWEVSNEEEWIAILEALRGSVGNVSVWLNGIVNDYECEAKTECRKTEALIGKGVPVWWKRDKRIGQYSRLYRGETEDHKCIYVEDNEQVLWNVDKCGFAEHVLLCVKTECFL
jgi:hypothetical protein